MRLRCDSGLRCPWQVRSGLKVACATQGEVIARLRVRPLTYFVIEIARCRTTPEWHILDNDFAPADAGLRTPTRLLAHGNCRLAIANLDRSDPPGYTPGGVPRSDFNANLFRLTARPRMPAIRVSCAVEGFDPLDTPILWKSGVPSCPVPAYEHRSLPVSGRRPKTFDGEWRGESHTPDFTVFGAGCRYTYSDETRVLGGHGLLVVAVRLPDATLCDYVHVRIAGTNPTQSDVFAYLDAHLEGYDENVVHMVRAIFQHESAFTQFAGQAQRSAAMTFTRRHHADGAQPDCRVRFDWPDDRPDFPLASFDFGVGISQFTRVEGQSISAELAWDWRENIRRGTNLFLGKLRRRLQPDITWKHLALAAWAAYNGSGEAAERYAQRLALSEEGARVSLDRAAGSAASGAHRARARARPAGPLAPRGICADDLTLVQCPLDEPDGHSSSAHRCRPVLRDPRVGPSSAIQLSRHRISRRGHRRLARRSRHRYRARAERDAARAGPGCGVPRRASDSAFSTSSPRESRSRPIGR